MAMGKTPIVTDCGGFTEYMTLGTGWLIPAVKTPVFGMQNWFSDLYTCDEDWWQIDIRELQKAMREVYENKRVRAIKAENGINRAYDFTHEIVGEKMKQLLEKPGL